MFFVHVDCLSFPVIEYNRAELAVVLNSGTSPSKVVKFVHVSCTFCQRLEWHWTEFADTEGSRCGHLQLVLKNALLTKVLTGALQCMGARNDVPMYDVPCSQVRVRNDRCN